MGSFENQELGEVERDHDGWEGNKPRRTQRAQRERRRLKAFSELGIECFWELAFFDHDHDHDHDHDKGGKRF